jgi:hypothetical protein
MAESYAFRIQLLFQMMKVEIDEQLMKNIARKQMVTRA